MLLRLFFVALCVLVWPSAWASTRAAFLRRVTIHAAELRLGDVVNLSQVEPELSTRARDIVITRVPRIGSSLLDVDHLAQLVRAKVPGMALWLTYRTGQQITVERQAPPPAESSETRTAVQCWETVTAITPGTALRRQDIHAISCDPAAATPDNGLRYDRRAHVIRAVAPLGAGVPLGSLPLMRLAGVVQGQELEAKIAIGHVVIMRRVTASQDASTGTRVFAATADGDLFSIHLAEEHP